MDLKQKIVDKATQYAAIQAEIETLKNQGKALKAEISKLQKELDRRNKFDNGGSNG